MMNWTRDQLLAASNLYHRTPFGKQHSTHPPIVALAKAIGRSPGAVAMKLNNFTSLDPAEQERGIKGLSGASNADRLIWNEFSGRMNELADESEAALERYDCDTARDLPGEVPTPDPQGPSERLAKVRIRRQQRFFRRTVLVSYGNRCCLTGNPIPELLRASHIIPWAESEEHRTDPRNGLCLVATFDAAFDRGLIGFDDDFRLVLSRRLNSYLPNPDLETTFGAAAGRTLSLPQKNLPDPAHLAWHRRKFCI